MRKALQLLSILTLFFIACKHDPIPGPTPPYTGVCSPDTVYFTKDVLPIFSSNCAMAGCHNSVNPSENLDLSNYNGIMVDIKAGKPNEGKIMETINDGTMPKDANPLSDAQKALLNKWISQGAKNNSCTESACDTSSVKFSTHVKTIIDNNCKGCHNGTAPNGGGIDLSTYDGVKAKVTDSKLWAAVSHANGASAMPKGSNQLSTCQLRTIKIWIDGGAQNN